MSIEVRYFVQTETAAGSASFTPTTGAISLEQIMAAFPAQSSAVRPSIQISYHGEQPLTIEDRYLCPEELIVTINACSVGAVTYNWIASDEAPRTQARTIRAQCTAPASSVVVRCSCHATGAQRVVLATEQVHRASHTRSEVTIHGVGAQTARMDVHSLIRIDEKLCNVTAHQVHKQLLLDKGARATSEPMLEVLSDDVTCSHGSAIRYLDADQLFYLQSRGYRATQARDELVKAFLTV